jgi:hypothetical protein
MPRRSFVPGCRGRSSAGDAVRSTGIALPTLLTRQAPTILIRTGLQALAQRFAQGCSAGCKRNFLIAHRLRVAEQNVRQLFLPFHVEHRLRRFFSPATQRASVFFKCPCRLWHTTHPSGTCFTLTRCTPVRTSDPAWPCPP